LLQQNKLKPLLQFHFEGLGTVLSFFLEKGIRFFEGIMFVFLF